MIQLYNLYLQHTVPDDFDDVLGKMTQHGYRVLALGYRKLQMPWNHAEKLERYDQCVAYCTHSCMQLICMSVSTTTAMQEGC